MLEKLHEKEYILLFLCVTILINPLTLVTIKTIKVVSFDKVLHTIRNTTKRVSIWCTDYNA